MRIIVDDTPDNWRKWGELIESWIRDESKRPQTVAELRVQLAHDGIAATVPGNDRAVEFIPYTADVSQPLRFALPSSRMPDTRRRATARENSTLDCRRR